MNRQNSKPKFDLDLDAPKEGRSSLTIREIQGLPAEEQRVIWESSIKDTGLDKYLASAADDFTSFFRSVNSFQHSLYPIIEAQKQFASNIQAIARAALSVQEVLKKVSLSGTQIAELVHALQAPIISGFLAPPKIRIDARPITKIPRREFDTFLIDNLIDDAPQTKHKVALPHFDKLKITLEIVGKAIGFPPNSMMHDLLLLIFSAEEPLNELWVWTALHIHIFGDSAPKKGTARKRAMDRVRLTIDRTNKRIAQKTLVADFILYENSVFRLNPKYYE